MQACRNALLEATGAPSHAGLLLAHYLEETDDPEARQEVLNAAVAASQRCKGVYEPAFRRWKEITEPMAHAEAKIENRLIVGLGAESALEAGLRLHYTYGTPLIPGSALKGLASHYCARVWGKATAGFRKDGECYRQLFGATDDAGFVTFHDAWITPGSLVPESGLALDVMTPHHSKYYTGGGDAPPSDFDDPIPWAFLSVRGTFYLAIECDDGTGESGKWAKLAMRLLLEAAREWGVGGKTNSGYGRLHG